MNLIREVAEKVNRPFAEKYLETQGLIAVNLQRFKGKVAVAFSGGKDSLVVLHMAWLLQPDVLVVFNNTGVEYPETVSYVAELTEKWNLNLVVTHPEKTFWQCQEEYGWKSGSKLGKGSHGGTCCYWCKEKPMFGGIKEYSIECLLTGTTAPESRQRQFVAMKLGACYHYKNWNIQKVHPITWWTEDEVWGYIRAQGLIANPIYAKGSDRCGCMPCTAYKIWEERMRTLTPKLYAIVKLRKDKQYVMRLEC